MKLSLIEQPKPNFNYSYLFIYLFIYFELFEIFPGNDVDMKAFPYYISYYLSLGNEILAQNLNTVTLSE